MYFLDLDKFRQGLISSTFYDLLHPASNTDMERFWQPLVKPDLTLPSDLDTILEDYRLLFNGDQMNPTIISARVDAILFSIVAAAKERNPAKSSGWGPKHSVYLASGETVTLLAGRIVGINCRCLADAALWYGQKKDLEANLIVRKATGPLEKDSMAVPGALLMLLGSRRVMDKSEGLGMYGIITDSYKWHFLWVDKNFQYFEATFDWRKHDERQTIINHIRDIVDHAISSVNTEPPNFSTKMLVSEYMSCLVWDEFEVDKVIPTSSDEEDY